LYRNSVNFMKITTEFTNFGCAFYFKIAKHVIKEYNAIGLKVCFCRLFRWVYPKTRRVSWVCTRVSESCCSVGLNSQCLPTVGHAPAKCLALASKELFSTHTSQHRVIFALTMSVQQRHKRFELILLLFMCMA